MWVALAWPQNRSLLVVQTMLYVETSVDINMLLSRAAWPALHQPPKLTML